MVDPIFDHEHEVTSATTPWGWFSYLKCGRSPYGCWRPTREWSRRAALRRYQWACLIQVPAGRR